MHALITESAAGFQESRGVCEGEGGGPVEMLKCWPDYMYR